MEKSYFFIYFFVVVISCGDLREDMRRIGNSKLKKNIAIQCPSLSAYKDISFFKEIILSKNFTDQELACKTFTLSGPKYSELIFFPNNKFKIYELSDGFEKKLLEAKSGEYQISQSSIEILPQKRKYYRKLPSESCLEINYKVDKGDPLKASWKWCL